MRCSPQCGCSCCNASWAPCTARSRLPRAGPPLSSGLHWWLVAHISPSGYSRIPCKDRKQYVSQKKKMEVKGNESVTCSQIKCWWSLTNELYVYHTMYVSIYTVTLHGTMKIKSPRIPSRAGKDLISHFRSLGVASLRYLRSGSLTRASWANRESREANYLRVRIQTS